MKRNKVTQSEATKHAKREARAREYLDRLGLIFIKPSGVTGSHPTDLTMTGRGA